MRASIVDQLILLAPVAHRDADLVGRNPKALRSVMACLASARSGKTAVSVLCPMVGVND
jgi:hypothetical protein